jgi:outer membrane protein assembly factor BamB
MKYFEIDSSGEQFRRTLVFAALFAALTTEFGCGGAGQGLAHNFPDNDPESLRTVLSRLQTATPRRDSDIVVGSSTDPSRLWAWNPESGTKLWEQAAVLTSTPYVAGDHVVSHESGHIVVRRLSDGSIATRVEDRSLALVGADGEGDITAIALSTGGAVGARSRLVVMGGDSVAWQIEMEQAIGSPAVRAGMVFVPWAQQNISVLDSENGSELARIRFTRGVVGHALADRSGIFFGQRGIALLTESSLGEAAPFFEPPHGEFPAQVEMLRDAYRPPPTPSSASHRARLVWRGVARSDGAMALEHDSLYFVFYRLVFALDANSDRVRWVAQLPSDVVGARVEENGLVTVDDQGRIHALSTTDGRTVWTASTGMPATWAHVSYGSLHAGSPEGEVLPVEDQLLLAAQNPDARLVPARAYAIMALASLDEPEVTNRLIALCEDHRLPAPLYGAACIALGSRETGVEHVLHALARHSSYLEGTQAPPVGALSNAAIRMNERRAVPLLIAHLRDPQTAVSDLPSLAQALRDLGDASARGPLGDFIRLYHAEAPDDELARALDTSIAAYVHFAGPAAQELLQSLIDDPMSLASVRATAERELTALHQGTAEHIEAVAPSEAIEANTVAEIPERITPAIISQVLRPIASDLSACLVQPGRVHGQARVLLSIEPDGTLHTVSITPREVQECLEPLVRSRTFPRTRATARVTISHVVTRQ